MQHQAAHTTVGLTVIFERLEWLRRNRQFEAGMPSLPLEFMEYGIAGNGVIAYRVQTKDPTIQDRSGGKKPLYLMTPTPLQHVSRQRLRLTVTAALPGDAGIRIDNPGNAPPSGSSGITPDRGDADLVHERGAVGASVRRCWVRMVSRRSLGRRSLSSVWDTSDGPTVAHDGQPRPTSLDPRSARARSHRR